MGTPDQEAEALRKLQERVRNTRRPTSTIGSGSNILWGLFILAILGIFLYINAQSAKQEKMTGGPSTNSEPLTNAGREQAKQMEMLRRVQRDVDAMQPSIEAERQRKMQAAQHERELEEHRQRGPSN